jgi:hypothetical protein
MKHPPEWIKPGWMKEAERRPQPDERPRGRRLVEVPRWQYYFACGFVLVVLILSGVVGSPGPLVAGIGVALVFLASCRPQPRRAHRGR